MPRPSVSIVIPHYLGDILSDCLEYLYRSDLPDPAEIVVVADQPYDDGSVERARKSFPAIRVLEPGANLGFAAACNLGIASARADTIALLNNDVFVTRGWLAPLLDALAADERLAACAPKVLSLQKPGHFDYSGAAGGMLDLAGFPFARGRIFAETERDHGQYDAEAEVFWVAGCAMVLRREALRETGLFDELLRMQMEEIDLCWRFRLHGWKVRVVPRSKVYHHGGYSLPNGSLEKTYLNYRNNLAILVKNLELRNLAWIIPMRVGLQFQTFAYVAVRPAEWRHAVAAVGGVAWLLANARALGRARARVQRSSKRSDREVLTQCYRRLITWDYFVRGARSVSDLASRSRPSPFRRTTTTSST